MPAFVKIPAVSRQGAQWQPGPPRRRKALAQTHPKAGPRPTGDGPTARLGREWAWISSTDSTRASTTGR